MLLDQTTLAVRVSNLVALVMLFIAGGILARYSGGSVWLSGAAMALTGAVLMAAIMALGGSRANARRRIRVSRIAPPQSPS